MNINTEINILHLIVDGLTAASKDCKSMYDLRDAVENEISKIEDVICDLEYEQIQANNQEKHQ